ncbi:MAG: glycoside hydrolase family 13 protein [Lachnospiraceae bacterium]|nr:glycoside hydrolase family 13 protein [Lachnospiraceae bacterium]
MNEQALFCDGTGSYVIPAEPEVNEKVKLRFRTGKNDVDEVRLYSKIGSYVMRKEKSFGAFDYYIIDWQLGGEAFNYCFEIHKNDEVCYYNSCGVAHEKMEFYCFEIVPGFKTPNWAKGAVMYQILVDRFYNGDPSNDVETGEYFYIGGLSTRVTDWNKPPANVGIREFYGGDLQGVLDKLDYLEELGVEVVYFNPLFVSPSNHKYDIQDYDYIDPHYGKIIRDGGSVLSENDIDNTRATKYQLRSTDKANLVASNELFIQLVEAFHERGMKVILDGVFNHCGSFNKWMDRERIYENQSNYSDGAYISRESPYKSFFKFNDDNPQAWPYNYHYDGWWGHDTLPKLNYEDSPMLQKYILDIGKKWVSPPYNVDGWRLDVAADLGYSNEFNHEFWKRFRETIKQANPEAIILAEHYGDPKDWLRGDEWDTVMNYDAFMEPLTWFLTGVEKHSDEERLDLYGNADNFVGAINHHMANLLTPSLQVAMNELSNHDHSRFLTRTNHMVGRVENLGSEAAEFCVSHAVMREAVIIQMTWVGAPTIYYGDEVGVCGFTDPDNRRTYPWGNENKELLEFHKDVICIHKACQSLKTGSLNILSWSTNIIAYSRFLGAEQIVVVVNNGSELTEVTVPVWRGEVPMKCKMERLVYTYEEGYTTEYDEYIIERGELVINMGSHSAIILKTIKN